MIRAGAIAVVLAAAALAAALGLGTGGGGDDAYRVRAIFDNAFSVIPGEDVKIAGVRVGEIESLDVTPERRAAVVLRIDEPGYGDFRRDARCTIRPQSLIGEKFVECVPTRPRRPGERAAAPLPRIPAGRPGAGQRLLGVHGTSRPVDLDVVNAVMELPLRQRLAVVLNEFGTGLAGRGDDLRSAIRRASPALEQTDRVLAVLARQNRVLAGLAREADRAVGPLARERAHVAGFVEHAGTTATATAARRRDLETAVARLPAFLGELRPTLRRVGALAGEAEPVLADLGARAPQINGLVGTLPAFSRSATPAVRALGDASQTGRTALVAARPLTGDVRRLGTVARPVAGDLDRLLRSFRETGGIERLMDLLFYGVSSSNGFDAFGHYLRAGLIVNLCSTYAVAPDPGCAATFAPPAEASASRAAPRAAARPRGTRAAPATPAAARPRSTRAAPATPAAARPGDAALLDYLLGAGS